MASERISLLKNDHMLTSYPTNESSFPLSSKEEKRLAPPDCAVNITPDDRSVQITETVSLDPSDPQALLSTLERTLFLLKTQVNAAATTTTAERPETK